MEFRHIFQRITKVLRITETIIEYYFLIFEKSSFLPILAKTNIP